MLVKGLAITNGVQDRLSEVDVPAWALAVIAAGLALLAAGALLDARDRGRQRDPTGP